MALKRTLRGRQATITPKKVKETTLFLSGESQKSRKYLDFVKQSPCCLCGNSGCDPHHLPNLKPLKSRRADDIGNCIGLCRLHHDMVHLNHYLEVKHMKLFRKVAKDLEDSWNSRKS